MAIDSRTITLPGAARGVQGYNTECYYSVGKGLELDRRARHLFGNRLACTHEGVLEQVHFIGDHYGGVAGFRTALSLARSIAGDI